MELSEKSRQFLENLRIYLFATGKPEAMIDEIVEELADHLFEAEKRGKSVDHVIGKTPEVYMKELAMEMERDYKELAKYGVIIMLGYFAFVITGDVIRNEVSYSWFSFIGYPFVAAVLLFTMMKMFKYLASRPVTKKKEWFLFSIFGACSILSFFGLSLLDRLYGEAVMTSNGIASMILFILAVAIFIGLAIWAKTWVTIIVPALLFIPETITQYFFIGDSVAQIFANVISIVGVAFYLIYILFKNKKKDYEIQ